MAIEAVGSFFTSMLLGKVHRKTSILFLKKIVLINDNFRLIKIVCVVNVLNVFRVKLALSSQKTVKDFCIISGSVILQTRIFQTRKNKSSLSCLWPRYFDMKIHT
jgi:hypothetical protein